MGVWKYEPWIAIVAVISIVVTASYILRVAWRVFFGELREEFQDVPGLLVYDKVALAVLCAFLIGIGWFPKIMTPWVHVGTEYVLQLLK